MSSPPAQSQAGLVYELDVNGSAYERVCAILDNDKTTPFESSQLYSSLTDSKFVDNTLRQSAYRTYTDAALFDACDEILKIANSTVQHNNTQFMLYRDATHIKYEVGGFFAQHEDYLSLTSNIIDEYTLLICVTPPSDTPCSGGETTFCINDENTIVSKATTTRGRAVLFRKDLTHEGTRAHACHDQLHYICM